VSGPGKRRTGFYPVFKRDYAGVSATANASVLRQFLSWFEHYVHSGQSGGLPLALELVAREERPAAGF